MDIFHTLNHLLNLGGYCDLLIVLGFILAGIKLIYPSLIPWSWRAIFIIVFIFPGVIGFKLISTRNLSQGYQWILLSCITVSILLVRNQLEKPLNETGNKIPKQEWTLLWIIVIFGFLIRVYNIQDVPWGMYNDEIVKGAEAFRNLDGTAIWLPFVHANKEFLYCYLIIPFAYMFGPNHVTLRLVTILLGTGAIFSGFFLVRRLFGSWIGLAFSSFLSFSIWYNCTNRIAERFNLVIIFSILSIFLVYWTISTPRWYRYIFSGIMLGTMMWSFPTFRIIPGVIGFIFLYQVLFTRKFLRKNIFKLILYWIMFILFLGLPLNLDLEDMYKNFVLGRGHEFKMEGTFETRMDNLKNLVLSFHSDFIDDMSFSRPKHPLLPPVIGYLFLVGLLSCVLRVRQFPCYTVIVWVILGMAPAIISRPEARRLTALIAPVYIFTSLGLYLLLQELTNFPINPNRKKYVTLPLYFLVITIIGIGNVNILTGEIFPTWKINTYDIRIARYINSICTRYEAVVEWINEDAKLNLQFLSYPYTKNFKYYNQTRFIDTLPIWKEVTKDVAYVFKATPDREKIIPILKSYYPHVQINKFPGKGGQDVGFYTAVIFLEEIQKLQGMWGEYHSLDPGTLEKTGNLVRRKESSITFSWEKDTPPGISFPFMVTYKGAILVPEADAYQFVVSSTGPFKLDIDNRVIGGKDFGNPANQAKIQAFLSKGLHLFQLTATILEPFYELSLSWESTEISPMVIPSRFFYNFTEPRKDFLWAIPSKSSTFAYKQVKVISNIRIPGYPGMVYPSVVESVPDGTFWVGDWNNGRLVHFTAGGDPINYFNPNVYHENKFEPRFRFAIDKDGLIYVLGSLKQTILIFDQQGKLLRTVFVPNTHAFYIAVDKDKSIYLILVNKEVIHVSPMGNIIARWGGHGIDDGFFLSPVNITCDKYNHVWIVDEKKNTLSVFDQYGVLIKTIPVMPNLAELCSVVIDDNDDNIYIAERQTGNIAVYSPEGKVLVSPYPKYRFRIFLRNYIELPTDISLDPWSTVAMVTGRAHQSLYLFQRVPVTTNPKDILQ